MPVSHLAPEIALALGAAACLLAALALPQRRQHLCALAALAALAVAAAWALYRGAATAPRLTVSGTHAVDALATWTTMLALGATAVVAAISPRWFATDRRHGEWYAVLLLSALGAVLLAGAADLMQLLVAAILASTTGYTLASFHRRSRRSAEAGARYFLLGAFANPILLLGIALLYGAAGATDYESLAAGFPAGGTAAAAAAALIVVGLALEIGAVPVHAWVPDVSEGAPAPAAAFLTVVPKLGALAAMMRLAAVFDGGAVPWQLVAAATAAATMTLGNLAALRQDDVRRLLGWSSVAQAGYGLMAIAAWGRSELALPALVLFMLAYAAANVGAFAIVVSLRGRTSLADYRGLSRARPAHAIALAVSLLSLLGLPPLAGFAAKLALFGAAIEAGYAWLAALAAANTAASVYYYVRVIAAMYFGPALGRAPRLGRVAAGAGAASAVLLLAAGLASQLVVARAAGARVVPATDAELVTAPRPPRASPR